MNGKEWAGMTCNELASCVNALNVRVVQLQRAKQRDKLPELQRQLHEMRVELKRKQDAEKRAKHNEAR